jgi:4-hydroxysphinganine ceramide fatty acyl 2-hydroxylase
MHDWTLDEYAKYINEPKHLVNPARDVIMFDNWFLENGSKTPWWCIPFAYLPVEYYFISQFSESLFFNLAVILAGILFWSFSEYMLHRFFFHGEDYWMRHVPKSGFLYAFHYTIHGIHHCFPMDKYRLVFPPVPGHITLYIFFYIPSMSLMPPEIAYPFLIGNLIGYQMYDFLHYFFHHFNAAEGSFIKQMKVYHM